MDCSLSSKNLQPHAQCSRVFHWNCSDDIRGVVQSLTKVWNERKEDVNLINLIFAKTKAESVERCYERGHDTNKCHTGWQKNVRAFKIKWTLIKTLFFVWIGCASIRSLPWIIFVKWTFVFLLIFRQSNVWWGWISILGAEETANSWPVGAFIFV